MKDINMAVVSQEEGLANIIFILKGEYLVYGDGKMMAKKEDNCQ